VDDRGVPVLPEGKEILVSTDEHIGIGGVGEGQEVVVVGVTAYGFDIERAEEAASPQQIGDLLCQ
jgi:hypothetical protein